MLLCGPLWVLCGSFVVLCGSFVGPLWSFAVLCGPLRYLVIPFAAANRIVTLTSVTNERASCNWVDLLQVISDHSSFQFMRCEQALIIC